MQNQQPDFIATRFPFPYLTYVVGDFDFAKIEMTDALVIAAKDKLEQFCHVEFPDKENALIQPRVWRIKAWRENSTRLIKLKEKSARERREANLIVENTDILAFAMSKQLGLARDIVRPMAEKIAKKKLVEAAKVWGVKLDI